jgi:hypothetical protein
MMALVGSHLYSVTLLRDVLDCLFNLYFIFKLNSLIDLYLTEKFDF